MYTPVYTQGGYHSMYTKVRNVRKKSGSSFLGLSLILPKMGHPEVRTVHIRLKVEKRRECCGKWRFSLFYLRFRKVISVSFCPFLPVSVRITDLFPPGM